MEKIQLLDVVVLLSDIAEEKLKKGQVGTVVELLDENHFEVEFADRNGQSIAILALSADELLKLIHEPAY